MIELAAVVVLLGIVVWLCWSLVRWGTRHDE